MVAPIMRGWSVIGPAFVIYRLRILHECSYFIEFIKRVGKKR